MKKTLKIIVGILGVVFTIIGWAISNTDQIDFVKKLIVPQYEVLITTYKKMGNKGFVLKKGDEGFSEIAEFFNFHRKRTKPGGEYQIHGEWVQIMKLDVWKITQFKTVDSGFSILPEVMEPVKKIVLEIKSDNFHTITLPFFTTEEELKGYYYNKPIFQYSAYIFWLGILISIISVFS